MPTRNIVLTPEQAKFIEDIVKSGRYQNASEVLREGLRLIQQREAEYALRLQAYKLGPVVNVSYSEPQLDLSEYTTHSHIQH